MAHTREVPVNFEDVVVYFSKEEWISLEEWQKELYRNVTKDNFQTLLSLGLNTVKPDVVWKIERGEDPCLGSHCEVDESEMEGDGLMDVDVLDINPSKEPLESRKDLKSPHEDSPRGGAAGDGFNGSPESEGRGSDPVTKKLQLEDSPRPGASERNGILPKKSPATRGLKAYRRGGKFICNGCGKNFRLKSHCIAHERIHMGENPFSCQKCGRSFLWLSQWKDHQTRICELPVENIHTGDLQNIEGHSVEGLEKLEPPDVTSGEPVQAYPCSVEDQEGLQKSESRKEESTYGQGGGRNQATLTEQRVTWTWKKRTSEGSCNRSGTQYLCGQKVAHSFVCGSCGEFFMSKSCFIEHERLHAGKPNHTAVKAFTSKDCGTNLRRNSELIDQEKSHIEDLHECTEYGEMYSRSCDLEVHMKAHAGQQPFTCSECGHGFMTQSLKAHQSCHAGNKLISRDVQVENFNAEHQRTHRKGRSFVCGGCGKKFSRRLECAAHERIHTGEKPFTCTECGKSFMWIAKWRRHMRCHMGEPLYACTDCGKRYSLISDFIVHKKSHIKQKFTCRQKTFKCPECGKSFINKHGLISHQKYRARTHKCTECGDGFHHIFGLKKHQKVHASQKKGANVKTTTGAHPLSFSDSAYSCDAPSCPVQNLETSVQVLLPKVAVHEQQQDEMNGVMPMNRSMKEEHPGECDIKQEPSPSFSGDSKDNLSPREQNSKDDYDCERELEDPTGGRPDATEACVTDSGSHIHIVEQKMEKSPSAAQRFGESCSSKPTHVEHKGIQEEDAQYPCTQTWEGSASETPQHRSNEGGGPLICCECGESFQDGSHMIAHEKLHTGGKSFTCSECGKGFQWHSQWIEHQRCHPIERTVVCTECGKNIHYSYSPLEHLRVDTQQNMSPEGEQHSIEYLHLLEHLKTCTSKPHACADCGKSFKLQESLVLHQKRSHTGERPYNCPRCEMSFARRHQFRTHYKTHRGEQPFMCTHCGKSFKGMLNLSKHQRIHAEEVLVTFTEAEGPFPMEEGMHLDRWQNEAYQNEMEDYSETLKSIGERLIDEGVEEQYAGECPVELALEDTYSGEFMNSAPLCDVKKRNQESWQHSEWQQGHLTSDGLDDSNECERRFSRQTVFTSQHSTSADEGPRTAPEYWESSYSKFNSTEHQGNRLPFICGWCGKSFLWKSHLIAHERIHTGEKPFICEECGERFRWRSQWTEHQRCHTGERMHRCSECGEGFPHKYSLLKHQKIHSLENMSPCSDSEQSSIDYLNLPERPETHTSKKPFQCAECGKSFKLHDSLVLHQKRSHTGEKPYTCPKCEMSFARRHQFRTHYKMHRVDRPFQCAHCGKSFKGRLYFLKHQRIHAGEMLLSAHQTSAPFPNEESVGGVEWKTELTRHEWNTRFGAMPLSGDLMKKGNLQEHSDTYSVKGEPSETARQSTEETPQLAEGGQHHKMHLFSSEQIQGDGQGNHTGCEGSFSNQAALTVPQMMLPVDGLHTAMDYKRDICDEVQLVNPEIQADGETDSFMEFEGTGNRQSIVIEQHIKSGGPGKRKEHRKLPVFPLRIIQVEDPDTGTQCEESFLIEKTQNRRRRAYTGGGPFICSGCGKSFRWRSHFIAHERIHTGEKPFICSECGKSFRWSSQWIDHQRSHMGERTHMCTECGESFHHGYALQKHQKIHSQGNMSQCLKAGQSSDHSHCVEDLLTLAREKPHACTDCGKSFKLLDSLVIHQRRVHTGERPYICTKCEKSFARRHQLRAHYKMHRGERPFPCIQCGKYFRGRSQLTGHLRTHAAEVSKPAHSAAVLLPKEEKRDFEEWQREICSDERKEHFENKSTGEGAMKREVTEEYFEKNPIKQESLEITSGQINNIPLCSEGNTKFRSFYNSERQLKEPADDEQNECSERTNLPEDEKLGSRSQILTECWRNVPKKVSLKPRRFHTGGGTFICSGCGKNFRWRSHLIAHERIHTGEKPFTCSECGRSFRWSSQWVEHQRSHTGEKPYACMDCGKRYSRSCDLSSHKRVHTGERPYKCVCGKSFIAKKRLIMHQKIHVRERKHTCTDCDESFHHSYTLLKHQRIHTRDNALQCPERENSAVGRHVTEHVENLPYACIECGKTFKLHASLIIHQRRIHTGERPFRCTKCDKSFTRRHQLRTHDKMHRKEQTIQYVQDGQSSRDRSSRLRKRQETHQVQVIAADTVTFHGEDRLELKKLQDVTSLADDGFIDKLEEINLRKCPVKVEPLKPSSDVADVSMCINKTGDDLQYPERQKGQDPSIKCEGEFSYQSTVHQKTQAGEFPRIVADNWQHSVNKVQVTGYIHAGDGPPYICNGCGKIFQWRSHFIAHERIHTGEKPFTCAECGKSFRWSSQWHDHQKSHTGEKLYACMECGKSYSQSSDLAIHKRTHMGEHLYTCSDCGRSFSVKQRLMIHQRSHTRKKH